MARHRKDPARIPKPYTSSTAARGDTSLESQISGVKMGPGESFAEALHRHFNHVNNSIAFVPGLW